MSVFESHVSMLLNGVKEPAGEGYLLYTDDEEVVFAAKITDQTIRVITLQSFEDELYAGCLEAIRKFAATEGNREIYAFCLYADEYNHIAIYMNSEIELARSVEEHKHSKYAREDDEESFRFAEGDFGHHLEFFNASFDEIYDCFVSTAYWMSDNECANSLEGRKVVMAFEKKLFDGGPYVAVLNVVRRLKNDFGPLNRTKDFVAYASTGNDYIDAGVTRRLTIDQELLYKMQPRMRELDEEFAQKLKELSVLPLAGQLDFWVEQIFENTHTTDDYVITRCEKNSFHALESLTANGGYKLVSELLSRIAAAVVDDAALEENEQVLHLYIHILHFYNRLEDGDLRQLQELYKRLEALEYADGEPEDVEYAASTELRKYLRRLGK